jgi:MFS family permease
MIESQNTVDAPPVAHSSAAARWNILFYSGVIIVVLSFINPSVGVFIIPLSFVLKNKLHLSANALAAFTMWASIPGFLCFAFGVIRDFWNPFGLGDRGYFITFGIAATAAFLLLAFAPVSTPMLLVSALILGSTFAFMWAAWNGLASTIGQQHSMSGQISSVWNSAGTASIVLAVLIGGVVSDRLELLRAADSVRVLFLAIAATMAVVAVLGIWNPRAVFAGLRHAPEKRNFLADIARLAKHWPIYPALAMWLLWNFSPGTLTVLQYYMSNTLHSSDAQWGAYNAISYATAVPVFALFGYLSQKFSLRTLLWVGATMGTFQMTPLLFVHTANDAMLAAVFVGIFGGIATPAIMDLLIRSCPKDLEGTMMMMSWSMYSIAVAGGNLWGTDIYDHHGGFIPCLVITTLVYAAILPIILLVPRDLIASADENI